MTFGNSISTPVPMLCLPQHPLYTQGNQKSASPQARGPEWALVEASGFPALHDEPESQRLAWLSLSSLLTFARVWTSHEDMEIPGAVTGL